MTRLMLVTSRAAEADPSTEDSAFGCVASFNVCQGTYSNVVHNSCLCAPASKVRSRFDQNPGFVIRKAKVCSPCSGHATGFTPSRVFGHYSLANGGIVSGLSAHADQKCRIVLYPLYAEMLSPGMSLAPAECCFRGSKRMRRDTRGLAFHQQEHRSSPSGFTRFQCLVTVTPCKENSLAAGGGEVMG
ncbi:hypothetical protein BGY98DRAFT_681535 [Russula aff. rugulosa BPL654]|nr:hypothetical protein BGY98DRAFT_681535 [Russula aff. rugulosa BPL654]